MTEKGERSRGKGAEKLWAFHATSMKALTLWEPWASLVASGDKKFETRFWNTGYRGWLAIHAAKKKDGELRDIFYSEPFYAAMKNAGHTSVEELPFGKIVAVVWLDCIYPAEEVYKKLIDLEYNDEYTFGNYGPGRFAWKFVYRIRLPQPITAKGSQGLWNWNPMGIVKRDINDMAKSYYRVGNLPFGETK